MQGLYITTKHKIILLATILIIAIISQLSHIFIGINITKSVPFTFYIKENISTINTNDYVLFKLPDNQLYKKDTLAVKQVVCLQGQYLDTKIVNHTIKYYCNGKEIGTLNVFKRPNGEPLEYFTYSNTIPNNYYFLLGNTPESYDGKYWGLVKRDNILKKVLPLNLSLYSEAYAETLNPGFYDDRNKGWYKYEVPTTPKKDSDNKTTHTLIKPVINWNELETMPVKEFAELFDKVQDYAMTYRTLENFDTYAKMRAIMFKRSQEFMNVSVLWGQLNPNDSSESWFPSSGFGQKIYQAVTSDIKTKYIRENQSSFGLVYFYRDDCPYCQKQSPLIKYFEEENHWNVKQVNTATMPDAMLRFNIQSVPSIIMVERKTSNWFPISSGLTTYDDIQDRVYRTIKYLKGETNEQNFADIIKPDVSINSKQ